MNALSLLNLATESYTVFIDHMNALIDRQKAVLKARATANAKRRPHTPSAGTEV